MAGYNVATYILESLIKLGVKRIYGIVGTSILDFFDALYDYSNRGLIRLVTVRHEQVAVSMADAEYRAAGSLGVAAVHAGPGFLNSLISLGIAYKDRVPLLLVSGGVRRRLYGTDAFLEVDQQSIAKPITKRAVRLSSEDELPEVLPDLIKTAFSKPRGPVMIEVPEDLWSRPVPEGPPDDLPRLIARAPPKPSEDEVNEALNMLAKASRPAILACGEVAEPGIEGVIGELADRLGAYVITTGNGRGACSELHPRSLGRVGFGGGSVPADKVLEEADVLLVLGDELDDIVTYSYNIIPLGDVVVVTESPLIEKRPMYYARVIKADPASFAEAMLRRARELGLRVEKLGWDRWVGEQVKSWSNVVEEALSRKYVGFVNPAKFFKKLSESLPENAVVVGGQGVHIVYTYAFMKIRRPRRFLAATNLGAMGYAFPAALGAKLALPDHEVIAVVGDGEFMMTVQDLETAVREGIPVKVVVVNDMSYRVLLLRQIMQKRGRIIGTLLGNPSFEELARAFRAEGRTVRSDDEVETAIREMLVSNKPYVLDLIVSQTDVPPLNIDASLKMGG